MAGTFCLPARRGIAAGNEDVTILLSGEEEPYRQAAAAMKAALPGRAVRILASSASLADESGLLVALGQKAARQAASQGYRDPVLAALIPRASYQAVLAGLSADAQRRWSAVVLDQPWSRQFALIRLLLPKARRLGLLVSNGGGDYLREIRAAAADQGLTVDVRQVNDEREMYSELRQLLRGVDAMLALPDSQVINRNTLESYLITAYRSRIPVIGYSRAMVDAGALAAVYSTPEDVGREVAETISGFSQGRFAYPRNFSVKLNHSVARSLELPIADEATLRQQLERGAGS